MTEIKFFKGDYGFEELEIKNHAKNPIVCSAISGLGMALVGTLSKIEGIINECDYRDGYISIKINPYADKNKQENINSMFLVIYIGLKQIELTYPENVVVHDNFLHALNGNLFIM